jgi:glycosyltransferase involved in cell wall biosynthesis
MQMVPTINGRARRTPTVSVGMPVFNGENYIEGALESLLAQSYGDFELIIADNASTDRTAEICLEFAHRDSRVRYHRGDTNIGAARNYNRVFQLASGRYFKWAAHDDICGPTLLEKCVAVLDSDPGVVLCHPQEVAVDGEGRVLNDYMRKYQSLRHLGSTDVARRFHDLACRRHPCFQVFGVTRRTILGKTPLIGSYIGADRVLLAELALYGRYMQVDENISFRRHGGQYCALPDDNARLRWIDPGRAAVGDISRREFGEYVRAIGRAPIGPIARMRCYVAMADWVRRRRKKLFKEVIAASV